jgi:hypothetical protein
VHVNGVRFAHAKCFATWDEAQAYVSAHGEAFTASREDKARGTPSVTEIKQANDEEARRTGADPLLYPSPSLTEAPVRGLERNLEDQPRGGGIIIHRRLYWERSRLRRKRTSFLGSTLESAKVSLERCCAPQGFRRQDKGA